jgi:hypothetical protein
VRDHHCYLSGVYVTYTKSYKGRSSGNGLLTLLESHHGFKINRTISQHVVKHVFLAQKPIGTLLKYAKLYTTIYRNILFTNGCPNPSGTNATRALLSTYQRKSTSTTKMDLVSSRAGRARGESGGWSYASV